MVSTLAGRTRFVSAPSGWRARRIGISAVLWLVVAVAVGPSFRLRAAEQELPKVRFLLAWGKKGMQPGEFHFPIGIAINRAGPDVILVTDHYNHRVQKFDRDGKLLGLFPVLPNPGRHRARQCGKYLSQSLPGIGPQ